MSVRSYLFTRTGLGCHLDQSDVEVAVIAVVRIPLLKSSVDLRGWCFAHDMVTRAAAQRIRRMNWEANVPLSRCHPTPPLGVSQCDGSESFPVALARRHPQIHRLRRRRAAGQALLEWAIMMVVLLWVCVGGVDFGRAYSTYIGITNAARVGARYAVLVPTATDAQVKAQVEAEQASLGITDSMIVVDRSQSDRRTVTITYPFTPITPLVARLGNGTTLTLTTWAAMPTMAS